MRKTGKNIGKDTKTDRKKLCALTAKALENQLS